MPRGSGIRAGEAFISFGVDNSPLLRGLRAAEGAVRSTGRELQLVGGTLLRAGAGIAAPLAFATKIFADFDDQIRTVAAVTGATDSELQALSDTARELGRTTSFTASQVAALQVELGRAGFDPSQVNEMTRAVLDLARATGTDAAQASGIAASTLRQFGLEASEAGRVADVLATGANRSFNTLEAIGFALSFAGPVARDANLSLEETVAILGALGNIGIQGSNAGTAIRRLLTLSAAESENFQRIFGVATADAEGNGRKLIDVLSDINDATAGLGNSDRAARFNEAFGLLGITAASSLSQSALGVAELEEALLGAEGAARRTAESMDAGIGGAIRGIISAAEGVAIAIGGAISGPLAEATAAASGLLGRITVFIQRNGEAVVAVTKFGGALLVAGGILTGLGLVFAGVGAGIAALASPLVLIAVPLAALAPLILSVVSGSRNSSTAFSDWKRSILGVIDALGILRTFAPRTAASLSFQRLERDAIAARQRVTELREELSRAPDVNSAVEAQRRLIAAIEEEVGIREQLAATAAGLNLSISAQAGLNRNLREVQSGLREVQGDADRLARVIEQTLDQSFTAGTAAVVRVELEGLAAAQNQFRDAFTTEEVAVEVQAEVLQANRRLDSVNARVRQLLDTPRLPVDVAVQVAGQLAELRAAQRTFDEIEARGPLTQEMRISADLVEASILRVERELRDRFGGELGLNLSGSFQLDDIDTASLNAVVGEARRAINNADLLIEPSVVGNYEQLLVDLQEVGQRLEVLDTGRELDIDATVRVAGDVAALADLEQRVVDLAGSNEIPVEIRPQVIEALRNEIANYRASIREAFAPAEDVQARVRVTADFVGISPIQQQVAAFGNNVLGAIDAFGNAANGAFRGIADRVGAGVESFGAFVLERVDDVAGAIQDRSRALQDLDFRVATFGADAAEVTRLGIEQQAIELKRAAQDLGVLTSDLSRQIDANAQIEIARSIEVNVNVRTPDLARGFDARALAGAVNRGTSAEDQIAENTRRQREEQEETNRLLRLRAVPSGGLQRAL